MNKQPMINNTMIRDCIIRAKRPSYEFRQQQRMCCFAVAVSSTALLGLCAVACLILRTCSPDPVPAYSMCEQCGELIGATDHGRCQADKVYVRAIIDPDVAQENMRSISGYVTNENGFVYFAVRGPACE